MTLAPLDADSRRHGCVERSRDRLERATAPRPDGLPNARVLLALPALLLIVGVVLIGLAINGSSSGAFRPLIESSADPDLIAGAPQMIRTDEWNVQTVWAIAQVEQGLPVTNETFPGGMDATLPQDLPRIDWSVAFRPHLLGFNFLELDNAIAWKWWFPGLALIAAAYCLFVTIVPRRPFTAAAVAAGFFMSPLFQWWYLSTTLWPAVWGLVAMTTLLWSFRSSPRAGAWVWAALTGYLTVVTAMGIYVPYIIPVVIVVAFFAIGVIVQSIREGGRGRALARGLAPIAIAGVIGSAVTGYWLVSKSATVEAFLTTAYPGERLTPTGASDFMGFTAASSSAFTQALLTGGFLGQNSSEASTFFYVGALLIPVVIWIAVRQRRRRESQPWLLWSLVAAIGVMIAFLFVPGWDAIAHLLFLDRTTSNRLRIGLGVASLVIVPLIVAALDRTRSRAPVWLAALVAVLYAASQIAIGMALILGEGSNYLVSPRWWIFVVLGSAALLLFARARPLAAAIAFLLLSVGGTYAVNPVYRGVYDLRETEISQAIMNLDDSAPAAWIGVGDRLTTALLVESGVEAYNGFQGAPSDDMWEEIDPDDEYEYNWNRLAGVSWAVGEGDPIVSTPYPDQILVTFDACDEFAQENVGYVLADRGITSPCLSPVEEFDIASGTLTIYRVE